MTESLFDQNMAALSVRYPALAGRVSALMDVVEILKAGDGGVAYGVRRNGHLVPITDAVSPHARLRRQCDASANGLSDFTKPVFIVGLYPGNELISVYDHSEQVATPHCAQPILVCIDSIHCLRGFMQTWDARRVIESERVRFFWHEDAAGEVQRLRDHPEVPHVFTLISLAPEPVLECVMPSFVQLIGERNREFDRLKSENSVYYDSIADGDLARIISGENVTTVQSRSAGPPTLQVCKKDSASPGEGRRPRRPRLMMPTCSWSTFIQHSTRDACRAFEEMGWEVRILKMDAMMTPYYLVKSIHEFKPDVFIFIDHMRYEAEEVYPGNMMFITWIQDDMPNLQSRMAGEKLAEYASRGKRDLVVGYVDGLDTQYGFPKGRLVPLLIPADPRIFHSVELTDEDRSKYGCDLAFMTNTSMSSEQVIEQKILPEVEPLGISFATCMQIHDDLWTLYREGKTLIIRQEFLNWLMKYPEFEEAWRMGPIRRASLAQGFQHGAWRGEAGKTANQEPGTKNEELKTRDDILRLFYWRLNDTIYRHVVLEWADEIAQSAGRRAHDGKTQNFPSVSSVKSVVDSSSPGPFRIHLYGQGWENHPRFARYACGPLEHGPELNKAYQAARHCLHLNIAQGMHQRMHEIMACGGNLLIRTSRPIEPVAGEPSRELMNRVASAFHLHGGCSSGPNSTVDPFSDDICRTREEKDALSNWIFNIASATVRLDASKRIEAPIASLEHRVMERIQRTLELRLDWHVENWERHCFMDRDGFEKAVRH